MRTANQLINGARQRGTILVSILLLVAVSAYIATEMTYRQTMDIRRTGSITQQDQVYELLLAAEQIAKLGLKEDLRKDRRENAFFDTVYAENDAWSEPRTLPLPGGYISGEVTELQGRFNINWLMHADENTRKLRMTQLEALLAKLTLPTEGGGKELVERIVDWLDVDDTPTGLDGVEDQGYLLQNPPHRAANRLLLEASELLHIPGITLEDLEMLEPYIAMLPPNSKLNLNTALPEVLEAIACLNSADIIKLREDKQGLRELGEVTLKTPGGDCDTATLDEAQFDVKSEYFLLNAEVSQHGHLMRLRAMLYRAANQTGNDAKIQVIYRKQLDPFSRV